LVSLVAIVLAGCGQNEPKPGQVVGNDPKVTVIPGKRKVVDKEAYGAQPEEIQKVIPPAVVLPKLATLQFTPPVGWNSKYLENENLWYIDRREQVTPGGDIKFQARIVVSRSPKESEPATLDAYMKFLNKPGGDEGGFVWPQVVQSGNLGDGFFIVAQVRQATDVTKNNTLDTGFIVVRTIGGDRIKFKCHKIDLPAQQEALDICRNARF
jgi:hypothetical protein